MCGSRCAGGHTNHTNLRPLWTELQVNASSFQNPKNISNLKIIVHIPNRVWLNISFTGTFQKIEVNRPSTCLAPDHNEGLAGQRHRVDHWHAFFSFFSLSNRRDFLWLFGSLIAARQLLLFFPRHTATPFSLSVSHTAAVTADPV